MNKSAKKWLNVTLAVGILSSGLVVGGGITAEASSLSTTSYTNPYYSLERKAVESVAKAEASRWLSDVSVAKGYVAQLKPSTLKNSLTSKLAYLEGSIMQEVRNAIESISKAEQTKSPQDIYVAKKMASVVKDPGYQNKFAYRLSMLEQVLVSKAHMAVNKVNETKLREDLVYAKQVVSYLNDGKDKTYLTSKLGEVEKDIQAISKATYYVDKLESTFDKSLVSPSRYYTSLVKDVNVKNKLMERIYKMEEQFRLQDQAVSLVKKAEYTKSQYDIQNAKAVVYKLMNAELRSELLARLRVLEYELVKTPTSPITYPIVKPVEPIVYQM